MVSLSRPYPFNFCKGYPSQILLGPFFNALTHTIKQKKPMHLGNFLPINQTMDRKIHDSHYELCKAYLRLTLPEKNNEKTGSVIHEEDSKFMMPYVVAIARCRVQYGKYFPSFPYFATYFTSLQAKEVTAKYEKRGKYLPILQEATCDNYFIVKCLFKLNVSRVILLTSCNEFAYYSLIFTNFTQLYFLHLLAALYFHISIRIFYNLFICLVFGSLLQSICFRMFCSKHLTGTY